ncbi:hypothetical protein GCM10007874_08390 [Labrys miyagiensis]|uniref:Secreted protein n=1 Tax=Labrys miyagiensis TaxID=346912 RepID=A0ABQ6CDF1_9HYPH|nr:hypothetical protein [Labrys miyagiensis]GLS17824.1 hypothetical protein GCM10007874_08390 [Labrys miyagiensis]
MTTRRAFLKYTALSIGAFALGPELGAFAADTRPLLDGVSEACRRLAPLGWRQMLLDLTGGTLDISATDLRSELGKSLGHIDRGYPGFGDFANSATRAIEPGSPDLSLLYHAFASPTVVADRNGTELGGFPTLAEIDAIESYIYGVEPPTMGELQARVDAMSPLLLGGTKHRKLGLVVYALQYRNAPMSVHGRHAELCFARSGVARLGTIEPLYDGRARNFVGLDPARPFDFRVVPRRFAVYLAAQFKGPGAFGPQDPLSGDDKLNFWMPVHKLFNGTECIAGLNLQVGLERGLRNDELAQFHRFLDNQGLKNNWSGEVLEQFPFTIRDEFIGSISQQPDFGHGVLEPRPSPMATPAQYEGRPLTFPVDGSYTSDRANMQLSSMQILPGAEPTIEPRYMYDAAQTTQRAAPEYINIRHRVLPNGEIDDLNLRPEMNEIMSTGGYQALHYIDGAGDGWIAAHCPQLKSVVEDNLPAYCMVGLPDFFPKVTQRELMAWSRDKVPKPIRDAIWAIDPLALSQTRIAGNIALPAGFSLTDTTITAIVSHPVSDDGPVQTPNGPWSIEKAGMPDGAIGMFDPGWETSQGIYYQGPELPLQKFLAGYGLGSPFIEDAKLCAALGAYWPGVAPDSTRQYQPDKMIGGAVYPYPTIAPLTDEEIGSAPIADDQFVPRDGIHGPRPTTVDGREVAFMSWDGVRGPSATTFKDRPVVAYTDATRVDYIDLVGTMTAALTSRIDTEEYVARILAMEAVYWGLGIHDPDITPTYKVVQQKAAWAVVSFKVVLADDSGLVAAEQAAGAKLLGPRRYFFHVYRWGELTHDPDNMRVVYIDMLEQAFAYVSGNTALIKRDGKSWQVDRSMPT